MSPLPRLALGCLVGLALWLGLILPAGAQTAARTLTLAEYQAELGRARTRLAQASAADAAAEIAALGRELQTIQSVELPSGETVTVLPLWYVPEEDAGTPSPLPSREAVLAQLDAVIRQLEEAPHDDTAARLALLDDVFRRAEFNTPAHWLDRLLRWLEEWWNRLFPDNPASFDTEEMQTAGRIVLWAAIGLGAAVIVWLLASWLQRLLRTFVDSAENGAPDDGSDLPRTAAEARAQAQTAAEAGEYRFAVRRLYLAALLQLAEQHWIDFERSLTNREVLGRLPADSPVYPHLAPVVETFDRVWYGIHEPDRATFDAYAAEIDALAVVARQHPPEPTAEVVP